MISERREAVHTMVLEKTSANVSPRLMELRRKIHDQEYVNNAISRIAQVISRKLVEDPDELMFRE